MRREQSTQTVKLRFIALVLALALVWYTVNPAPRPVRLRKGEDELPDDKKRSVEPQVERAAIVQAVFGAVEEKLKASSLADEELDDFEWPDFIDG